MIKNDSPEIHPETIKMAEYIHAITVAGSVHPVDAEFVSPIQCKWRRSNRMCRGKIKITQRLDNIEWQCTKCESCGIITGWRNGDCDLSKYAIASDSAGVLKLSVPEEEYRALQKVMMFTHEHEAMIAGAVWTGEEVLLIGQYADLDRLAGNLAFEVNHSRGKKQLVLNDLSDRVEALLN